MKAGKTYLYLAAQTAKKFRNLTLSDAQLRNQALAAPYFSCKTNLLYPQEGHISTQMRALKRQEGHIPVFSSKINRNPDQIVN